MVIGMGSKTSSTKGMTTTFTSLQRAQQSTGETAHRRADVEPRPAEELSLVEVGAKDRGPNVCNVDRDDKEEPHPTRHSVGQDQESRRHECNAQEHRHAEGDEIDAGGED